MHVLVRSDMLRKGHHESWSWIVLFTAYLLHHDIVFQEKSFLALWKHRAFNTNIVPSHIFASRCIIQASSEHGALPDTQVHTKRQAKEIVRLMAAVTCMDAWKRTSDGSQEGGLRGSDAAQEHVYRSALTECSFRKGQSLPNRWGDYIIVTFHFITEQQDTL